MGLRWSRSTKLLYPTGLVSTGMGDHVRNSTPGEGNQSQYIASHLSQLSLAIPPWVGAMSTSQRAVMLCGWEVKAGIVCVWMAGKTVIPLLSRAISERFRDVFIIRS